MDKHYNALHCTHITCNTAGKNIYCIIYSSSVTIVFLNYIMEDLSMRKRIFLLICLFLLLIPLHGHGGQIQLHAPDLPTMLITGIALMVGAGMVKRQS